MIGSRVEDRTAPAPALRPMAAGDIDTLRRIDRAAHGESWSAGTFAAQIDDPAVTHLVAVDDGDTAIGHAAAWHEFSTLRVINVATDPTARGRGVATRLLVALLGGCGERVDVERLQLEVRPENRSAQRLYSRFGFAPVGVARDFYDRRDDRGSRDALVMAVEPERLDAVAERCERIRLAFEQRDDQEACS